MDAKRCDRCGSFYYWSIQHDPEAMALQLPPSQRKFNRHFADLCEECRKSLRAWFRRHLEADEALRRFITAPNLASAVAGPVDRGRHGGEAD